MEDLTKRLPHLPEVVLRVTAARFHDTLPIPIPDTPENRAAAHAAAIEAFVTLNPANAAVAALAQMIIIAEATAAWCEQRAKLPDITPQLAHRFARQAKSWLNTARSSRRMLGKFKPPPTPAEKRAAAARAERAARIRALDLRRIRIPPTMH